MTAEMDPDFRGHMDYGSWIMAQWARGDGRQCQWA